MYSYLGLPLRAPVSRALLGRRFHAGERKVKPLRASQSLAETLPCTCYNTCSLTGKTLRGNHVAHCLIPDLTG